jgi:hypothetical protein
MHSCAIEATIRRAGNPYEGEAQISVQLENEQGKQRTIVAFQRAPYVIAGLIPGHYRFSIYKPFHRPELQELDLTSERSFLPLVFDEGL